MTAVSPADTTAPLAHSDVIVLDYLAALWAESDDLSPELRDELMTTVAEYIALRRTSVGEPLADPEQIVGRLGPPEALVASVRRGRMPSHLRLPVAPPPRPVARNPVSGSGSADATALVLLMAGTFVLPVISPLAAMTMVSSSPRWTSAQKSAAWVLAGGSMLCGLLLTLIAAVFMYDGFTGLVFAYLAMVAGAFVAGITLLPGLIGRRPITG